MFWQLTIDANDPARLARFWAQALGYQPEPPTEPKTTWHALYRSRLGPEAAFDDRPFDPAGLRPRTAARAADRNRRNQGRRAGRARRQRGATDPTERSGGPDLLRRHARPGGQRVLRRLSRLPNSGEELVVG